MWGFSLGSIPGSAEPQTPLLQPLPTTPPPSLSMTYAVVGLGGVIIGIVAIVLIEILRPNEDNATLDGLVITALTSGIGFLLNFIRTNQTIVAVAVADTKIDVLHQSTNSGFERFEKTIKDAAFAAGIKAAEDKAEKDEADAARMAVLVAEQVALALAARGPAVVAPAPAVPTATANVTVSGAPEAVSVEEVLPQAAQAIADAVRPGIVQDVADAVTETLPPKDAP